MLGAEPDWGEPAQEVPVSIRPSVQIPAASGRITVAVGSHLEGGSRGGPGGHIEGRAVTEGPSDLTRRVMQ